MLASPQKQYEYLVSIAPVDPANLIDLDETLSNAEQFYARYGWAPVGESAYFNQIFINGVPYSTIAAYSMKGFLCWNIYEGSVTATEVIHFITTSLCTYINESSYCILDNATVHGTDPCLVELESVCRGRFKFCPPYSPELKPIERGFANVKRYAREHENEAGIDPVGLINRAFHIYSLNGPLSAAGE